MYVYIYVCKKYTLLIWLYTYTHAYNVVPYNIWCIYIYIDIAVDIAIDIYIDRQIDI